MMIWRNFFKLCLSILILLLFSQAAFAVGELQIFSTSGKPFLFKPQPGQVINDKIFVKNLSKTLSQKIRIYPQDAITTSDGKFDLLREGQKAKHVGTWIHMSQSEATLMPGETKEIPFTLTMPKTPEPGQYIGGILAQSEPITGTENKKGVNFRVIPRVGIFVTVNAPGEQMQSLSIQSFNGNVDYLSNEISFSIAVKNAGNMSLAPNIMLLLKDNSNKPLKSVKVDVGYLLPGNTVKKEIKLDQYANIGLTKAELRVNYAGNKVAKSTVSLFLFPLKPVAGTIGALLAVIAIAIIFIRKFDINISRKPKIVLEEAVTKEE